MSINSGWIVCRGVNISWKICSSITPLQICVYFSIFSSKSAFFPLFLPSPLTSSPFPPLSLSPSLFPFLSLSLQDSSPQQWLSNSYILFIYSQNCLQYPTPSGFHLVLVFRCKQKQDTHTQCICTLKQPQFQVVKRTPWGTWNSGGAKAVFQVQPACTSPFLFAASIWELSVWSWLLQSSQVSASGMGRVRGQADVPKCLQPWLHWSHARGLHMSTFPPGLQGKIQLPMLFLLNDQTV